jgi:hypothetical protein
MIFKDFLEQIRHTKISGKANGNAIDTIELGAPNSYHKRFSIESFNGNKIEKTVCQLDSCLFFST